MGETKTEYFSAQLANANSRKSSRRYKSSRLWRKTLVRHFLAKCLGWAAKGKSGSRLYFQLRRTYGQSEKVEPVGPSTQK